MSDTDSNSSSPRRSNYSRLRGRLLASLPLRTRASYSGEINQSPMRMFMLMDGLRRRERETRRALGVRTTIAGNLPVSDHGSSFQQAQSQQTPPASVAPAKAGRFKGLSGPAVTLVSALPTTTYKDQDDTKGTEKTLSYLKAQRAILKYLETHAADTLTALQARKWTQAIDPTDNKEPRAEEALRLCYYMRSQGYDAYAKFDSKTDGKMMRLYIANQQFHGRDKDVDQCYWEQDFATNATAYAALSAPHTSRRNARVDLDEELGYLQTGSAPARDENAPASTAAQTALNDALVQAELQLHRELTRENADSDAIVAALEHHASIQAQLEATT